MTPESQGIAGPKGAAREKEVVGGAEEKGCMRCVDVIAQPLKGKAMPPHRSPFDDYTSTVTPFDPDTLIWPNQNPTSLSLQLLVPIGPSSAVVKEGKKEWMEKKREKERKTGKQQEGGRAKGQLVVRGFYWECGRERAGVGECVKDHRLRF